MADGFNERYKRLIGSMAELASLLTTYGEEHWAEWVLRDRQGIERGQRHGLDSMLSAFGGMGSLTDLAIHPLNGHAIEETQLGPVNDELARLRGVAYSEATARRRDLDHT